MFSRLARRPLVPAALCCLIGAAAGSTLGIPPIWWGVGAVLAGLFVCWKRGMALLAALTLVFMMEASWLTRRPMPAPHENMPLSGVVCQTPVVSEERTVLTLSDVTLNGQPIDWNMRVYAYEPVEAQLGDRITMTADTWLPQGRVNPYGFDFDAW